jgi:hypothetical protein
VSQRYAFALCATILACRAQQPDSLAGPAASAANSATPLAPEFELPAADVLALLGNLQIGDALGPGRVDAIGGVRNGRFAVRVRVEQSAALLEVAARTEQPPAPVTTSRYSVYWSDHEPGSNRVVGQLLIDLCKALGARLVQNEERVAVPAGLATFEERPKAPSSI